MLQVTVNGRQHQFASELTILQALRSLQIEIPSLCHDERLKPFGGCRLCVVRVEGRTRPVIACETLLADGMAIETHSPAIEEWRRSLLRLLAQQYPREALQANGGKEFHKLLCAYGMEQECAGSTRQHLVDASNPYIQVDMSDCIYCYRCVRICSELQGQFVWQVWNRGDATRIRPDSGTTLRESSCVSCGACVDTCPTGALEDKSVLLLGKATNWTRTTCAYCGTGCEMNVGTRDGRIVTIKPVPEAPVSHGHLCVKGRYAFDFVHATDRVTQPMIRMASVWKRVSWGEAISFTADALRRIVRDHGPDSVGILGSARGTNEENYLAQKFARVVVATNNVDCCARVCHAPTAAAMKVMLGTGAATNSFDDIEQARTILVFGANPTENHPIVGARIKQAALRGAALIVVDPRQIELARYATLHLQLRPGTNVALLNAMACAILEEGLQDRDFLRSRADGFDEFQKLVQSYSPERVESVCGVEAKKIREAARLYASNKPAMCVHGLGATEHTQGTDGVMCLVNVAVLTGNIGRRGSGINPLRGQNNVQGSAHMGCEPASLTGSVTLAEGTELFSKTWRAPVPTRKGLNLMGMLDAARDGELKALWMIGYDVFLTNPHAEATRLSLQQLELVIVQDMFLTESAREFGTVLLPAASSFEKDGTFMNAERRVQRVRKAISPLGASKPDWEILCDVARAMGMEKQFNFSSAEEIWNEVRSVWEAGAGISYERLEHGGIQWPCPTENHPGTQVLHTETFAGGDRARLQTIEYEPTTEAPNEEFPFTLMTGRTLYQFNAGTMSSRTQNVLLRPADTLDISAADAEKLGLSDGQRVRVCSRYGEAILPIYIENVLRPGELFATFHTQSAFLNRVTGPHRDRKVGTPEYKITAVKLEKV